MTSSGYNVEVCSTQGGKDSIHCDPACLRPDSMDGMARQFVADKICMKKVKDPPSLRSIINSGEILNFCCLYLCGGHGCVDDFYENADIEEAVQIISQQNCGLIAAICHGILGLVSVQIDGVGILMGKECSVFSNAEEEMLHLATVLPKLPETEVSRAGAICTSGPSW